MKIDFYNIWLNKFCIQILKNYFYLENLLYNWSILLILYLKIKIKLEFFELFFINK